MHVVNPHQVSHTRLRCQASIVLISLQLCVITSVEANLHAVGERSLTEGISSTLINTLTLRGQHRRGERRRKEKTKKKKRKKKHSPCSLYLEL